MYSNNLRLNIVPKSEELPKNGIKKEEESLRLVKNPSSVREIYGNQLNNTTNWADVQLSLLRKKAKAYLAKIGNDTHGRMYDVHFLSDNDPVRLHLEDKNVGFEVELEEIVNQSNIASEQGDQEEYIFSQEMLRNFENRVILKKNDKTYKYILKCSKIYQNARAKLTELVHDIFQNNLVLNLLDENGEKVTVISPKCTV